MDRATRNFCEAKKQTMDVSEWVFYCFLQVWLNVKSNQYYNLLPANVYTDFLWIRCMNSVLVNSLVKVIRVDNQIELYSSHIWLTWNANRCGIYRPQMMICKEIWRETKEKWNFSPLPPPRKKNQQNNVSSSQKQTKGSDNLSENQRAVQVEVSQHI